MNNDHIGIPDENREAEPFTSQKTDAKENPPISFEGKRIYQVKVIHSHETILGATEQDLVFSSGDAVIISTKHGKDLGRILCPCEKIQTDEGEDVHLIHRKAADQDLSRFEANREREEQAFKICQKKIYEHNLEMKLVSTHYLLDEPKILFFFTADNRVDFRELVKDLVGVFKTRIELRQIGVRDEARVLGGIGICGRAFCCHAVTDKLNPVSIKMAKEQNISLNSLKISGPCGRLLCCLGYEYEFYHCEKKHLPVEGMQFTINNEQFVITEINVLIRTIRLSGITGRVLVLPFDVFKQNEEGRWLVNDGLLSVHVQ